MRDPDETELPQHVVATLDAISKLRAEHEERGSSGQRLLRSTIAAVTRPRTLMMFLALAAAWMAANGIAASLGLPVLDKPPFFWMDTVIAVVSLCVTLTILTIQRRDDELSALREQLALELAVLSEQKSAKVIELIEELRRDLPAVRNRDDEEASEMAQPCDPAVVMEAIESIQKD